MGYELHVRRRALDQPAPELPALEGALREAGATGAEGAFVLPAGGAKLPARISRAEGALVGLDLDVPYGAPDEDFQAALLLAAQLAAKLGLVLQDPQLGAEITPAQAEQSLSSWRTANRYALETAGNVEDVRNAAPLEAPKPGLTLRTKVILGALGILVLAYLILNWVLGLMLQPVVKPID